MTDTPETTVNDPEPDEAADGESSVMAALRKEAAEGKAAKAELAALQRERAFDKAGIPENGPGKWFRKGYEGDLEVEALREAAIADGLIDIPADAGPTAEVAAAAAAADRIATAASDGGTPEVTIDQILASAETVEEIESAMNAAGLGVAPT